MRPLFTVQPVKVDLSVYKYMGANFWIISIVSYLLEQQIDINILGIFSIPASQIAFYSLSGTLTTTISVLTIAGLGGVSLTALSAVHAEKGELALGRAWELFMKFTTLLSVPLLVFAFFYADEIMLFLYSSKYLPAATFLRWFCIFQIVQRICGGGANITALYAMGRKHYTFRSMRLWCHERCP